MLNTKLLFAAVAVVLAMTGVGCGSGGGGEEGHPSSAEARAYVIDHIKTRLNSVHRAPPYYRSASDLLGNVRYAEGDRPGKPITDAVVIGTVSDVAPGYGFAPPSSAAEDALPGDGVQVPFDSSDALWRTVHITVNVEEVLSGDVATGTKQISVGLAIGNVDEHLLKDGLMTIGRSVWFLQHGSPVFAYDNSFYAVLEDGGLVAEVMPDDSLSFPMLAPNEPSAALLRNTTLVQLREASKAPAAVVQMRRDGNLWVR